MKIILASASPRRRELLEMLGVNFEIVPASDEVTPAGLTPGRTVELTALGKAASVEEIVGEDALIIGADTMVFAGEKALGKPADEDEAFNMLKELSGREHTVYTGVAVIHGKHRLVCHEKTRVSFCEISDEEIRRYIATGEPMDKAGAYGAQGKGAIFIEKIHGDFFNVMGLPVHRLSEMLKEFGISLM